MEVIDFAVPASAEADGLLVFLLVFGDRVVVEGEFFAIADWLETVHGNTVFLVCGGDDGSAVGVAGVTESAGEVTLVDRVDIEDIITSGVVLVTFEHNVVEVWEFIFLVLFFCIFLDKILLFEPTPRSVNFSEVLSNEIISWNSILTIR